MRTDQRGVAREEVGDLRHGDVVGDLENSVSRVTYSSCGSRSGEVQRETRSHDTSAMPYRTTDLLANV